MPSFHVLRRSFSTHPTVMQAQIGHSDPRTMLEIDTRTLGPEVFTMANQVANRVLSNGDGGNDGESNEADLIKLSKYNWIFTSTTRRDG